MCLALIPGLGIVCGGSTRGEVSLRNPVRVGGSELYDGEGEMLAEYYTYR